MDEKFFVDRLERIFRKEGYYTGREIGAGYGVADLVLVSLDTNKCSIRKGHGQSSPLLNEAFFKVLKNIPDINKRGSVEPVNLDTLIKKTKFSKGFLKYSILQELEKTGYIKMVGNNTYFKVNGWVPLAKEVIAIEAKIKDWKRGFLQAYRYKTFADNVYLAIPDDKIKCVNFEMLTKNNVGLISFNPRTDEMRVVIESKRFNPLFDHKRDFVSEFFWQYA